MAKFGGDEINALDLPSCLTHFPNPAGIRDNQEFLLRIHNWLQVIFDTLNGVFLCGIQEVVKSRNYAGFNNYHIDYSDIHARNQITKQINDPDSIWLAQSK